MAFVTTPIENTAVAVAATAMTSPSRLWVQAGKLAVQGRPWGHPDTQCVLCASAVHTGDLAVPYTEKIDAAFNFKLDCHVKGEAICGHCLAVWETQWMQANSKSYAVQGEGIFYLRTKEDIAAFLLEPPAAPYVAIFNIRQQCQMIWRTPVGLPSAQVLVMRLDDTVMTIDINRVLAGVRAWQQAGAILKSLGRPKASTHILSYDMSSTIMGKPIDTNYRLVREHSDAGASAMITLDALAAADWWALCACREVDLGQPATWPRRRVCEIKAG